MKTSTLVTDLILEAFQLQASDIHFLAVEEEVKIFFRIQTELKLQRCVDKETYIKILRYVKFKTKLDISNTTTPQDGAYSIVTHNNKKLFIRISTMPAIGLESLVVRLLPDEEHSSFESIALFSDDLKQMYNVLKEQNGLFVFTGPTGSGKSTSMYSILTKLAKDAKKKILTLENPVEMINRELVQININEELGITYSAGLKFALRQDPDIIMIGEIRDEETARNVFRAALTGHTVISTMHTKDKYGVVERFLDFGFLKSEIESVLIGISNQRLVVDQNNDTKSFFDYAVNHDLHDLINNKEQKDIYEKIKELKATKKII